MSLLNRSNTARRGKKLLLVAVPLILAAPCIAAAAFTFSPESGLTQKQENAQKAREEKERAEIVEYTRGRELGQEEKERREKAGVQGELEEKARRQQIELELHNKTQAALASLAKITMDQAIQIALSQQGGKVLECSLVGERWESPGKLAKDGRVLYHVVIFTGDEANPVTTHLLINAIDGTVFKSERERERPGITGGKLNGKAVSLPQPEYPQVARMARASGAVEVEVTIDETGNVVSAHAISGHPLLQAAAVNAARGAQFSPTKLNGEPVQVRGVLTYQFVAN